MKPDYSIKAKTNEIGTGRENIDIEEGKNLRHAKD